MALLPHYRLENGDLVVPNGYPCQIYKGCPPQAIVIPFAASCPPDTEPFMGQCIPSPGTPNVNYGCGGLLAPLGIEGCLQQQSNQQVVRYSSGGGGDCIPFGGDCGGGRMTLEPDTMDVPVFSTTVTGRCPTLAEQLRQWITENWWWLLLILLALAAMKRGRK